MRVLFLIISWLLWTTSSSASLEITTKYNHGIASFIPPSISIYFSGKIELGDLHKVADAIQNIDKPEVEIITFNWDSPGGNLIEGIKIGQLISKLPHRNTYSNVGSEDNSKVAFCASSCVFAYLGSKYRSLPSSSKIGVHKFYSKSGDLTGEDALSNAQSVSGLILSYLQDQNIDVSFYNDIISAEGDEIYWVPRERLIDVNVVNDGLTSHSVDYGNIDGKLSLRIEQNAAVGVNVLRFMCGDNGLYGIAFLMEPPQAKPTEFAIKVGGMEFIVPNAQIVSRDNFTTMVVAPIPPAAMSHMGQKSSIGAYYYNGPDIIYGFQGEISDPKIAEMANSCNIPKPKFSRGNNADIAGGDITAKGHRNVSLEQCESICLQTKSCIAVSYVQDKRWCWPKDASGKYHSRAGVITSILSP